MSGEEQKLQSGERAVLRGKGQGVRGKGKGRGGWVSAVSEVRNRVFLWCGMGIEKISSSE